VAITAQFPHVYLAHGGGFAGLAIAVRPHCVSPDRVQWEDTNRLRRIKGTLTQTDSGDLTIETHRSQTIHLRLLTLKIYQEEVAPHLFNAPSFESTQNLTAYYLETFSPDDPMADDE
jgi:hypothetical protein